jgi:hypothetical protein
MDDNIDEGAATLPNASQDSPRARLDLIVREGRGRLGGTMFLDLLIQRARENGRRVKPLDGDLKSRTLSTLYPAKDAKGHPIEDGASCPASDDIAHQKAWIQDQLNQMTEDRVSRILDLSGGDRVMQELVLDLMLKGFCQDFGIGLTNVVMLGPDIEDFNHAMERIQADDSRGDRVILVLNEGVIRQGQTAEGAFDAIMRHPDFEATLEAGARYILLRRLSCMSVLRERRVSFYDAALGRPDQSGAKVPPTVQHMTKVWLAAFDRTAGAIADWLP